jgi:hypothetical protein
MSKELKLSTQKAHLLGLQKQGRQIARGLTPQSSFDNGLILQTAELLDATSTRLILLADLSRLVRAINATRSFQTEDDQMDAIDDILEIFPSMKLEEVLLCFKFIRQGKYELFGNLTTNVLIKCLKRYELENTIPLREIEQTTHVNYYETANIDWKKISANLVVDDNKKSLEELGGHVHLTREDLEEIEKAKKETY